MNRTASSTRFAILTAAMACCALLAASQGAMAKPKVSTTAQGCTAADLNTSFGSACVDQQEKDLLAGVAYPHLLFCDESGVQCCESDGTRTFACKSAPGVVHKPNPTPISKFPSSNNHAP